MPALRIDELTRRLSSTLRRRPLLAGLAGGALGVVGARPLVVVEAGNRRTRDARAKTGKPNAFGCLNVGATCQSAGQCCSGICSGKKGQKQCRGHHTGICDQQAPGLCTAANPAQTLCDNSMSCVCLETTGQSKFCGSLATSASRCADCQKDADCMALGFPPGSACVPFATGACAGACASGMICAAPRDTEPPGER